MDTSFDQVLQAALTLPEQQRAELVDTLIGTLEPEAGLPFDDHWLAEIAKRSREYDEGKTSAIDWGEVKARGRKRISSHD